MTKPFVQHYTNGKIWSAGKTVWGLCAAWNHATNPSRPMFDNEHKQSAKYAKAIMNRMKKLGFVYGVHYRELSNGSLWPNSSR